MSSICQHMPDLAGAPEWFLEAINAPQESHNVKNASGDLIHIVSWNKEDCNKPPLLFIHGYRANTHVWDFIAPFFVDNFQVFAMDLGGMGNSGHRKNYNNETYNLDLDAVISAIGEAPVTLVGHSFGGDRALQYAAVHPNKIKHLVILDTLIKFSEEKGIPKKFIRKKVKPRVYPDYGSIIVRHQLLPKQPVTQWIKNYISFHSVKQVSEGWQWKFDPGLPLGWIEDNNYELLLKLKDKCHFISGEHSAVVSKETATRIANGLKAGSSPIFIPDSYHHIMVNQPLALVSALIALLKDIPANTSQVS